MTTDALITVRRVGAIVLAVAALIVTLAAGPSGADSATPVDYTRLLDIARSDYDSNNDRTSGAPQQQVVNGWFARDALSLQVLQLDDLLSQNEPPPADDRIMLLGLIAVLAICLYAATSPVVRRPDDPEAPPRDPALTGAPGTETSLPGFSHLPAPPLSPPVPSGPPGD